MKRDLHATREDLDQLRLDLKQDLERFATKQDLETWGMALAARIDTLQTEMRREIRANRIDLGVDLVRHVRAMDEQYRAELGVVDEKSADLPARVKALEDR